MKNAGLQIFVRRPSRLGVYKVLPFAVTPTMAAHTVTTGLIFSSRRLRPSTSRKEGPYIAAVVTRPSEQTCTFSLTRPRPSL